MEVIRAKRAGACYGVQRALDMADEVIADGSRAYTLGPLIHNPQVVADLAARGAEAVGSVEDICWEGAAAGDASAEGSASAAGDVPAVVIRSHGVTPQVLAAVEDRGFTVVDATCPHVSRAQHAAAELAGEGCRVIVVGEAGHPEVEGLTAWAEEAGGKVDVVAAPEEIPEGLYDPVGVVAQTTQRRENLEAVVAALRAAGLEPIVKNTICSATRQRQEAAADLASAVDAMVVIGGRNSSNTTRLAEVCALTCPRTFHIESADELDPAAFAGCRRVGVTAGASTPENQIAAVEKFLRAL
ncbi:MULTISPECIES: 4-hydroxy-3-methylbut-2-enyl diphosphate reductase [Adlercreutzia]|uniref:4-hydroxy-3-methylbut-2-enyl diphosphate reductase n=2 Tax=Adlercreutzia TaxID=447020 RepID=A0A7K1T715_9ACTN|nr:4-hydroxy-3-methylbut-2-enyl diphosphate reductase [Adlercreutzia equolifaciens]MCG4824193.1 4-hydroxy-3-methylbut-2-enyl diphosphate reductase [Adlercreutzia equolifaciens]MDR3995298.1 4-hydroxy-3-methylbut-2-enyl diphosphate reductase [Adlercreutzia sp.]MVN59331.1 4-hydroxy-3-methylbut-2-enyl diphosphate reductase [Adlercreutzia rubneri]MZG27570.1 4-hydroxy-3-methylbut-2-enyl diphosphate reductase [Adlercreutzia equolifaciens]